MPLTSCILVSVCMLLSLHSYTRTGTQMHVEKETAQSLALCSKRDNQATGWHNPLPNDFDKLPLWGSERVERNEQAVTLQAVSVHLKVWLYRIMYQQGDKNLTKKKTKTQLETILNQIHTMERCTAAKTICFSKDHFSMMQIFHLRRIKCEMFHPHLSGIWGLRRQASKNIFWPIMMLRIPRVILKPTWAFRLRAHKQGHCWAACFWVPGCTYAFFF